MVAIKNRQFFKAHDSHYGDHLVALDRVAEFYRSGDNFYAQIILVTGVAVQVTDPELLDWLGNQL